MKTAYYARSIGIYGTPTEDRDMALIRAIGFQPIDVNQKELQEAYKEKGMEVFLSKVKESGALFFRPLIDGSIGAGVAKEISWAQEAGIPVVEIPVMIRKRSLSAEETREALADSGQR